jgi:hypothetical protein
MSTPPPLPALSREELAALVDGTVRSLMRDGGYAAGELVELVERRPPR